MISEDIFFVGFREIPHGLEGFLNTQGYTLETSHGTGVLYEHIAGQPALFYTAPIEKSEGDAVPNWNKSPVPVVAKIAVNCPIDDSDAGVEGDRIATALTRKYNGVFYDTTLDEFFTRDDL